MLGEVELEVDPADHVGVGGVGVDRPRARDRQLGACVRGDAAALNNTRGTEYIHIPIDESIPGCEERRTRISERRVGARGRHASRRARRHAVSVGIPPFKELAAIRPDLNLCGPIGVGDWRRGGDVDDLPGVGVPALQEVIEGADEGVARLGRAREGEEHAGVLRIGEGECSAQIVIMRGWVDGLGE
jgi:hypothetical protein